MTIIFRLSLTLFLLNLFSPVGAQPSAPAKGRQIKLQFKNLSLNEALGALQKQTPFSWIVDGDPLTANASLDFVGTTEQATDRIAELYDYKRSFIKSGIAIFHKKFLNVQDRPQTNMKEIRQVAKEIAGLIESVKYEDSSVSEDFLELLNAFTPLQVSFLLRDERNRIYLNEMSERQRTLAEKAIFTHAMYEPARVWRRLNDLMKNLEKSQLEVATQKTLDFVHHTSEETVVLSLASVDKSVYPHTLLPLASPVSREPNQEDSAETFVGEYRKRVTSSLTLKELLSRLSTQFGSKLECAEYLSERHLSADLTKSNLRNSIVALCETYDWRWSKTQDGTYFIQRKSLPNPSNLELLIARIAQALPVDTRAFLRTGLSNPEYYIDKLIPADYPGIAEAKSRNETRFKLASIVQFEPENFFKSLSMKSRLGEKKKISDLSSEQLENLVFTLFSKTILDSLDVSSGEITPYQKDPKNASIELTGKSDHYTMTLSYFNRTTQRSGGGFATSPGKPTPIGP